MAELSACPKTLVARHHPEPIREAQGTAPHVVRKTTFTPAEGQHTLWTCSSTAIPLAGSHDITSPADV